MKKIILVLTAFIVSASLFAAESKKRLESKSNVILGSSLAKGDIGDKESTVFSGAYLLGDICVSNEKLTAGGKIYYRITESDSWENNSQKLEIKRAYIRIRPFGNEILEISGGKLYSYYLSGNFFNLSEIYSGATRWGKTGVGLKSNFKGFTLGLGIPLTESYVKFTDDFGINAAFGYDFAELNKKVPLKAGADFLFNRKYDEKNTETPVAFDYSGAVSLTYAPSLKGFVSKFSVTGTYNYNAEPFVASSVFKNVSNYKADGLKNAHLASLNFRSNFGPVQFILEGEAGKSLTGNMIPLYCGTQLLIPVVKHLDLKPRFYYYAALNSQDSSLSRQSFEIYPRLWLTFGEWTVSAGADFINKQISADEWKWSWSIPCYVEFKIK